MKKNKIGGQVVLNIILIVMALMYLLPFLYVISVSFTDETSLIVDGYRLIPAKFSTRAYEMVFSDPTQILNSYRDIPSSPCDGRYGVSAGTNRLPS